MQETKINRKSNCTNCNIPGCKQTPFCKYTVVVSKIYPELDALYISM